MISCVRRAWSHHHIVHGQRRENVLQPGMGRWGRDDRDLDQTRFCELLLLWAESVCDTIGVQEQGIARGKDDPFELEIHVEEHTDNGPGRVITRIIRQQERLHSIKAQRLFS
jgi:hypothetical protein